MSKRSTRALLFGSAPVIIAAIAFSGFIAASFIPPSPSATFFDLSQRVKETRSTSLSKAEAIDLDRASATLAAAQRAIKGESEKPWMLRSYSRARTLLWKAELLLDESTTGPRQENSDPAVPAG